MKHLFFILLSSLFAYNVISAQDLTYDLSLQNKKNAKSFNKSGVSISIGIEVTDNLIVLNLKANNNVSKERKDEKDNKYKYYFSLFDRSDQFKGITSLEELYKDAKVFDDGLSFMSDDEISFNGIFIDFNKQILRRIKYKNGYNKFAHQPKKGDEEKFNVIVENITENTDLSIKFIFLVSDWNNNEVLGITKPIVYAVPGNVLRQLMEPSNEKLVTENIINEKVQKPVTKKIIKEIPQRDPSLVSSYENMVSDLIAPFKKYGSYNDRWNNYQKYFKYDNENYSQRIQDLINRINSDLKGEVYRADRQSLVNKLEKYVDKNETIQDNISKLRPKTINKCDELTSTYNNIIHELEILTSNVRLFSSNLEPRIQNFELQLDNCSSEQCYQSVKIDFDNMEWGSSVLAFDEKLRVIDRKYNKLKNNSDFKSCGLKSSKPDDKIKDAQSIIDDIEAKVADISGKIEANFVNQDVFRLAIAKFKPDINTLTEIYESSKELNKLADDELWETSTLSSRTINELRKRSDQLSTFTTKIEEIIEDARIFYVGNDNNKTRFSESLFKQRTGIDFNKDDIRRLKSDLDQHINKGEDSKGGNLATIAIIIIVVIILLIGGYAYLKGFSKSGRAKTSEPIPLQNKANAADTSSAKTQKTDVGGMEIIDEGENESQKGIGLDRVRKLTGIEYFEIDVKQFIHDSAVRKVYFSRDFIKKAYWYFEDKMRLNENIDDLYEFGGYIIGKWDFSPYDNQQYELSLEHFIEPGEDAHFTKFNIDFGYDISFRMEEILIDQAAEGNELVFVGWLHSHPGHNVFLSNYDIDVQDKFRNQYHPNRHIALVLEPTTEAWDMGLFTFKQNGVMNNKEDVHQFLSFDQIYQWARGETKPMISKKHFSLQIPESSSSDVSIVSFDKTVILEIKKYIERELGEAGTNQRSFLLEGILSDSGAIKHNIFNIDMIDFNFSKLGGKNNYFGIFTSTLSHVTIDELTQKLFDKLRKGHFKFVLVYQVKRKNFEIFPVTSDKKIEAERFKVVFSIDDLIPYTRK